jgi:hypothetical protein
MPVREARKGGARRRYDHRLVLDAIFFVLRSGCQWRMIPRDLLPWDAAYRWYGHWRRDGTWDPSTTRSGTWSEPSAAVLDAQSIVSDEGGQARGFDMAKRTRGRKRAPAGRHPRAGAGGDVHLRRGARPARRTGHLGPAGRRVPHRRAGLGRWRLRQPHRQLPAGMGGCQAAAGRRDWPARALDDPSRRAIRLGQSVRDQIRRRSDTLQPGSAPKIEASPS